MELRISQKNNQLHGIQNKNVML